MIISAIYGALLLRRHHGTIMCMYIGLKPTQWTWVWVDSRNCWWTGRPGVLWFMGSRESDTTEWLTWAELMRNIFIFMLKTLKLNLYPLSSSKVNHCYYWDFPPPCFAKIPGYHAAATYQKHWGSLSDHWSLVPTSTRWSTHFPFPHAPVLLLPYTGCVIIISDESIDHKSTVNKPEKTLWCHYRVKYRWQMCWPYLLPVGEITPPSLNPRAIFPSPTFSLKGIHSV